MDHVVPKATIRLVEEGRFYLDETATTIMLKFLPPRLVSDVLLHTMDEVAQNKYDFFFFPRSRQRRTRNIDMCFVNFVDHASAVRAGEHLSKVLEPDWIAVCQAGVQGFLPNVAFFVMKSGYDALWQDNAPMIFQAGQKISTTEAFASGLISQEKLWECLRGLRQRQEVKTPSRNKVWEVEVRQTLQGSSGSSNGTHAKDALTSSSTDSDPAKGEGASNSLVSHRFAVESVEELGLQLAQILATCGELVVSL
ncbi:unnamed protein product [Effrenium voratum]|nr:unnamed protein product [Effrenium voratum]